MTSHWVALPLMRPATYNDFKQSYEIDRSPASHRYR